MRFDPFIVTVKQWSIVSQIDLVTAFDAIYVHPDDQTQPTFKMTPSRVQTFHSFKVEWLGNPLLQVFVSVFGPDRAQRSIAFLSF